MTAPQTTPGLAVVTGASAGIGSIYAQRLAARGHDLLLIARRADRLEDLAQRLRDQHGITVETLVADLSNAAELTAVSDRIATDLRVTVLVNNAGTSKLGKLIEATSADQLAMIDLNITALTRLSVAVLPAFLARNRGTIVNIGSILGFHTLANSAIYSGTKGYVMNFTRGLVEETAGTEVRIQLVMPAITATDLWELSGVPLHYLDQNAIMPAEKMVDAALAGLDGGEVFTLPSVAQADLWSDYDAARVKLLGATQTGTPAPRYNVA
jgi:short-subunit dehydrogenase